MKTRAASTSPATVAPVNAVLTSLPRCCCSCLSSSSTSDCSCELFRCSGPVTSQFCTSLAVAWTWLTRRGNWSLAWTPTNVPTAPSAPSAPNIVSQVAASDGSHRRSPLVTGLSRAHSSSAIAHGRTTMRSMSTIRTTA
jgi:hypothetical protein